MHFPGEGIFHASKHETVLRDRTSTHSNSSSSRRALLKLQLPQSFGFR